MESDLAPLRPVLLAVALALIALGLLPVVAAAAPASAGPTSLGFGMETVGKTSGSQGITISNPEAGDVQLAGVSVVGADPGDFRVTGDGCGIAALLQGAMCSVEVAFAPTAAGPREAALQIAVEGEAAIAIPLSGSGQTMKLDVPGSSSFPTTSVGGASVQKVALKNLSEAAVNVNEVKIEGANPGDFGIEGGNCTVFIGPGMSCELNVRFSPTATGPREARLRVITDGAPAEYETELLGESAAPEVTFEPGGYDFGLVEAHSDSPRANLTLRNVGAAAVQLSNLEISGPDANEFFIQNSNCWGTTLSPGSTCSIEVQFNANNEGSYSAAVSIRGGGVPFQAPLTGRAARPQVTVSPAPVAFGTTTVGSVKTRKVTLTNTGQLPVAFFIALVSGGDISSFHLVQENCTSEVFGGAPRVFEPGESCAATIAFEPNGVGAKAATVSFFGAGEGAMQVAVEGTAVAPRLALSPSSRDFGAVPIGNAGPTETFRLRNESEAPRTIDSATLTGPDLGEFRVRSDECTETVLDPGAACAVVVRFAPQSAGAKNATLRLHGPDGTTAAGLSGEGTAATSSVTEANTVSNRGRVAFNLDLRPGPVAGGVTVGRARCASSEPCVVRLRGLISGQIANRSGRRTTVRGLPPSRLTLAPGESAAITTALSPEFRNPSPRSRLQISLRWRTGSFRGAGGKSFRLGKP